MGRTLSRYTKELRPPRTAEAFLSGNASHLKYEHLHFQKIMTSKIVEATLKGCKYQFCFPLQSNSPMGLQDLILVTNKMYNSYGDALFETMLSVTFHGLRLRLEELVSPECLKLKYDRKFSKESSLIFFSMWLIRC
ncbi:hypothetical protein CROQUDRAFT_709253 [Cronartium quercuum f. sp. fusiforme G11]|uniref:Uncharacterized protein n=1 Tax=Cronartium quercuum f. sp. fusiforme G11 TaxID=708437 RepID=A0A9P6TA92_9BASI|nr:hypothetical protein CROQUDRAFT_709253 [Cronartium quercuum f. sp. fusiforme G11]